MTANLYVPALDLAIIVIYLAAILLVGIISARRTAITGQVFFLAGRSLSWGIVGAALFASNISTIHLVGLTASGYNEGLVWGTSNGWPLFRLSCSRWSSHRSTFEVASQRCRSFLRDATRPRHDPFSPSWRLWRRS